MDVAHQQPVGRRRRRSGIRNNKLGHSSNAMAHAVPVQTASENSLGQRILHHIAFQNLFTTGSQFPPFSAKKNSSKLNLGFRVQAHVATIALISNRVCSSRDPNTNTVVHCRLFKDVKCMICNKQLLSTTGFVAQVTRNPKNQHYFSIYARMLNV